MRGLSINQPSASAVAWGFKEFETRSWPVPPEHLGARIAIHASKVKPSNAELGKDLRWLAEELEHREWLLEAGFIAEGARRQTGLRRTPLTVHPELMPRGVIVATAVVAECVWVSGDAEAFEAAAHRWTNDEDQVSDAEWMVGDFSPGRVAWRLTEVCRLEPPIPQKGAQGLFAINPETARLLGEGER